MELLLEQLKQLQDSVDINVTREKKLKQDVVQRLEEEQRRSACLEGQKRELEDPIKESSKQETEHHSKNEVLLSKLQDAEWKLKLIEETSQPPAITSSARTTEVLALPFPAFIPPSSQTHLSGRWIMGEDGMLWITYNNPLPWVVPWNTPMTGAHWYIRYFLEHRFTQGKQPSTAKTNESYVTTAYIDSKYNPEGICSLEVDDDEEDEEVDKLGGQPADQPKPFMRFPTVDVTKFPPRPSGRPEPVETTFPLLSPTNTHPPIPNPSVQPYNRPPSRIVNGYLYPPSHQAKGGPSVRSTTSNSIPHQQRWTTQDQKQCGGPIPNRMEDQQRPASPWKQHTHPRAQGVPPRHDQPSPIPGIPRGDDIPQDNHDTSSLGNRSFGGYSQPAPYQPGRDNPQPPGGYPHDSHHYFPSGRPRPRIPTLKVKPDCVAI
jgi:hypothetical protein